MDQIRTPAANRKQSADRRSEMLKTHQSDVSSSVLQRDEVGEEQTIKTVHKGIVSSEYVK